MSPDERNGLVDEESSSEGVFEPLEVTWEEHSKDSERLGDQRVELTTVDSLASGMVHDPSGRGVDGAPTMPCMAGDDPYGMIFMALLR
ncbi:hypothetical protein ACFYUK_09525 [Nonomuraea wenchangensis]